MPGRFEQHHELRVQAFREERPRRRRKEEFHPLGRKDPVVLDHGVDDPAEGYVTVDVRDNADWEKLERLLGERSPVSYRDERGDVRQLFLVGIREKHTGDGPDGRRITTMVTYNWVEPQAPRDAE